MHMCRDQLAGLLRLKSSQSGEGETSLADYVQRMQSGQQGIFYISADSVQGCESSPFVEKLQKRGLEVCTVAGLQCIDKSIGDVRLGMLIGS